MKILTCKFLVHRGNENIALHFEQDSTLLALLRKNVPLSWSRKNKCWYCLCTRDHFEQIKSVALQNNYSLDYTLLKSGMEGRFVKDTSPPVQLPAKGLTLSQINCNPVNISIRLSGINAIELEKFRQRLILRSYSPSTIRTYTNELIQFMVLIKQVPAFSVSTDRIKQYLQYCHQTLHLSESTLHSRINALKFYYEQVLHKDKFFWEVPRPKRHLQMPKVLGESEIRRMFNAITNLKHKAILFAAYSAGLRVSEVVSLKIKHVDSDRMQLFVEKAKGKKDRYVGLSILLLDVLRAYIKKAVPAPKVYVFENPMFPGQPYSVRGAQKIFQMAKERAFVNKDVGIHSLRHSFATHLLEKGIDIKYIKELLGHFNIKTTERYLHVKRETLVNIPNVLDELNKSISLEW
ncbi:MAG: tyrosine-type recombinase/integrase [Ferruginibacter sp.]